MAKTPFIDDPKESRLRLEAVLRQLEKDRRDGKFVKSEEQLAEERATARIGLVQTRDDLAAAEMEEAREIRPGTPIGDSGPNVGDGIGSLGWATVENLIPAAVHFSMSSGQIGLGAASAILKFPELVGDATYNAFSRSMARLIGGEEGVAWYENNIVPYQPATLLAEGGAWIDHWRQLLDSQLEPWETNTGRTGDRNYIDPQTGQPVWLRQDDNGQWRPLDTARGESVQKGDRLAKVSNMGSRQSNLALQEEIENRTIGDKVFRDRLFNPSWWAHEAAPATIAEVTMMLATAGFGSGIGKALGLPVEAAMKEAGWRAFLQLPRAGTQAGVSAGVMSGTTVARTGESTRQSIHDQLRAAGWSEEDATRIAAQGGLASGVVAGLVDRIAMPAVLGMAEDLAGTTLEKSIAATSNRVLKHLASGGIEATAELGQLVGEATVAHVTGQLVDHKFDEVMTWDNAADATFLGALGGIHFAHAWRTSYSGNHALDHIVSEMVTKHREDALEIATRTGSRRASRSAFKGTRLEKWKASQSEREYVAQELLTRLTAQRLAAAAFGEGGNKAQWDDVSRRAYAEAEARRKQAEQEGQDFEDAIDWSVPLLTPEEVDAFMETPHSKTTLDYAPELATEQEVDLRRPTAVKKWEVDTLDDDGALARWNQSRRGDDQGDGRDYKFIDPTPEQKQWADTALKELGINVRFTDAEMGEGFSDALNPGTILLPGGISHPLDITRALFIHEVMHAFDKTNAYQAMVGRLARYDSRGLDLAGQRYFEKNVRPVVMREFLDGTSDVELMDLSYDEWIQTARGQREAVASYLQEVLTPTFAARPRPTETLTEAVADFARHPINGREGLVEAAGEFSRRRIGYNRADNFLRAVRDSSGLRQRLTLLSNRVLSRFIPRAGANFAIAQFAAELGKEMDGKKASVETGYGGLSGPVARSERLANPFRGFPKIGEVIDAVRDEMGDPQRQSFAEQAALGRKLWQDLDADTKADLIQSFATMPPGQAYRAVQEYGNLSQFFMAAIEEMTVQDFANPDTNNAMPLDEASRRRLRLLTMALTNRRTEVARELGGVRTLTIAQRVAEAISEPSPSDQRLMDAVDEAMGRHNLIIASHLQRAKEIEQGANVTPEELRRWAAGKGQFDPAYLSGEQYLGLAAALDTQRSRAEYMFKKLQVEHKKARDRVVDLTRELRNAKDREKRRGENPAELEQAKNDVTKLEGLLREMRNDRDDLAAKVKEAERLAKASDAMSKSGFKDDGSVVDISQEMAALRAKLNEANEKLNSAIRQMQKATERSDMARAQAARAEGASKKVKERKAEDAARMRKEAEKAAEEARKEITALKKRVTELEKARALLSTDLGAKISELEATVARLNGEKATARSRTATELSPEQQALVDQAQSDPSMREQARDAIAKEHQRAARGAEQLMGDTYIYFAEHNERENVWKKLALRQMIFDKGFDSSNWTSDPGNRRYIQLTLKFIGQLHNQARAQDLGNEYWINSLLSGVMTQFVNNLGNIINSGAQIAAAVAGATVMSALPGKAKGDPERNLPSDFLSIPGVRDIIKSILFGIDAFRYESSPLHTSIDLARRSQGKTSILPVDFFDQAAGRSGGPIRGMIRTPGRVLLMFDEMAKVLNGTLYARAEARRLARQEFPTQPELQKKREEQLMEDYGSEAWVVGIREAERALFQSQNKAAESLTNVRTLLNELQEQVLSQVPGGDKIPVPGVGSIFVPFIKTPLNILATGAEYVPVVGALGIRTSRSRRKLKDHLATNPEYENMLIYGKQLIGITMALGLLGLMTSEDEEGRRLFIPPGNPRNPKERAAGYRTGTLAVLVGDTYVDLSRIEPFGTTAHWVSSLLQSAQDVQRGGDRSEALSEFMTKAMGVIHDKSFLTGASSVLQLFENPDYTAGHVAASVASGMVPNLYRSWSRQSWGEFLPDRTGLSTWEKIVFNAQLGRQRGNYLVGAMVDYWGNPVPQAKPYDLMSMAKPTRYGEREEPETALWDIMIARWNNHHPNNEYLPPVRQKRDTIIPGAELSMEEYTLALHREGKLRTAMLRGRWERDEWRRMTEDHIKTFEEVHKLSAKISDQMMKDEIGLVDRDKEWYIRNELQKLPGRLRRQKGESAPAFRARVRRRNIKRELLENLRDYDWSELDRPPVRQ